jgi:hypothetical protein
VHNIIIETILKHSYRGEFGFSVSDAIFNEMVAKKLNIPGIAAIDIASMHKYLQARVYLGLSRKYSFKIDIKLEYEGFRAGDKTAELVFNWVCPKLVKKVVLPRLEKLKLMSARDGKLAVDFYKIKSLRDNGQIMEILSTQRHLEVGFNPGVVAFRAKLVNDRREG